MSNSIEVPPCDFCKEGVNESGNQQDHPDAERQHDKAECEPLRRFDIEPLKPKQASVEPAPRPAIPSKSTTNGFFLTDRQFVMIVVIVFALIFVGGIVYAAMQANS